MEPLSVRLGLVPVLSLLHESLDFFMPLAHLVLQGWLHLVELQYCSQVADPHTLEGQIGLVVFSLLQFFLQKELSSDVSAQYVFEQVDYLRVPVATQGMVNPVKAGQFIGRDLCPALREMILEDPLVG